MYINLKSEELDIIVAALSTLTIKTAVDLRSAIQEGINLSLNRTAKDQDAAYVLAAQRQYSKDNVCEIDEDALVSIGDGPGAYVMAWVWVAPD